MKAVRGQRSETTLLLRRARKTLRFMQYYFALQANAAKGAKKDPTGFYKDYDWRETYAEVSACASAWCKKALAESRKGSGCRHDFRRKRCK